MPHPSIDTAAALDRYLRLTAVPGRSGEEKLVAESIVQMLVDGGLDPASIDFDDAHQRTRIPGNVGNLIVTLPGDEGLPRTMLSAHMDTVPICVGCEPHRPAGPRFRSSRSLRR
ncbi:MAG: hypothetical protein AAF670_17745 [Planctomycetota bacterium]